MIKDQTDVKAHAWAVLLVAHSRLIERIEATLAAAELPPLAWYDVLWALENADDGRMRMHELAERVVISRPNLTRLADRLENAKLIARESCPNDRRGANCVITPAGQALRKQMWPVYRDAIFDLFAQHISEHEAEILSATLERVARAAHVRAAASRSAQARPQSRRLTAK